MKLFNILIIITLTSCASKTTKDSAFMALSSGNQTIEGDLVGLDGNDISNISLSDIKKSSEDRAASDKIFARYRKVLSESEEISLYPRHDSFVLCLKWSQYYICDFSKCMGIEYSSKTQSLEDPNRLVCK